LVLTWLKLVCLPLQEFTSWNLLMQRATEREWDRVDHLPCCAKRNYKLTLLLIC
jgi:hypothetical protein